MLRSFSSLSTGVARSEGPAHSGKITTWAVLDQFNVREVASTHEIGMAAVKAQFYRKFVAWLPREC